MSSIDDRIVRLEVQDSDFAKRLNQDEAALRKVDKAFNELNSSNPISENLQKITDRFSNLGVVGMQTLKRIADGAIDAGTKLAKSLSVDNIASGWEKMAQQTKAVGTLAIQGFDQAEVDKTIKQLMWYSDETSYNFNDMLTAMTKFTAQSYDLEDALTTLEGIANWSAVAGQNAAAGSTAMQILSKAVGKGYVGQNDWGSLQTIMMDNKQIRQMILDNAVKMGTLEKVSDNTYRSLSDNIVSSLGETEFTIDQFATYLTTGKWLTSDVMVATMKQYAEAVKPVYEYVEENNVSASEAIKALNGQLSEQALQFLAAAQEARSLEDALESVRVGSASTWQTTFNTIFGDYEQQKELWTDLSEYLYNLFVDSGNARNDLLKEWAEAGGRDKLIQGFYNIMDAITKLKEVITTAWRSIFPAKTSEDLLSFTEKFEKFTEKIANATGPFYKIGVVLQGIFSLLKLGKMVISALLEPVKELFGLASDAGILDIAVAISSVITKFVQWLEVNDKVHLSLEKIGEVIKSIVGVVIGVFEKIFSAVSKIGGAIKDVIVGGKDISTAFKDLFTKPTESANKFKKQLDDLQKSGDQVVDIQLAYAEKVDKAVEESASDSVGFFQKIKDGFSSLGDTIANVYTEKIKPVLEKIVEFLGLKDSFAKGFIPGLISIFTTILSFKAVAGIADAVVAVFGGVADIIRGITGIIGIFGALYEKLRATAFLRAAVAIGLLVAELYALSKFDQSALAGAIESLSNIATAVGDAINNVTLRAAAAIKILSTIDLMPIVAAFAAFAAGIWGVNVLLNIFDKAYEAAMSNPENASKMSSAMKDFLDILSGKNTGKVINFLKTLMEIATNNVWSVGLLQIGMGLSKLGTAAKTFAKNFKGLFNFGNVDFKLFKTDTSLAARILKVAASIGLIVGALWVLTNYIDSDKLWDGIAAIGSIAAGLAGLTFVLAGLSNFLATNETVLKNGKITKSLVDIGKITWNISKSVVLLAAAAVGLAWVSEKLDPGSLTEALEVLAGIAIIIAAIETVAGLFVRTDAVGKSIKSVGAAFAGIAISMGILSVSIITLSSLIEDGTIHNAIIGIGGGLGSIAAALALVLFVIKGTKMSGTIIAASIAFVLAAVSMVILTDSIIELANSISKTGRAFEAAGSLAVAILGIAGAVAILGKSIVKWKVAGLAAVGVGIMEGVILEIGQLAESLSKLSGVSPSSVWAIAVAMIGTASAIGYFAQALMLIAPAATAGVPALIAIAAVIATIAAVIAAFGLVLEGLAALINAVTNALIRLDQFCASPKSDFGASIGKSIMALARPIGWLGDALNKVLDIIERLGPKNVLGFLGNAGNGSPIGAIINLVKMIKSAVSSSKEAGKESAEAYADGFEEGWHSGGTHRAGAGTRITSAADATGQDMVTIAHSYQNDIRSSTEEAVSDMVNTTSEGGEKSSTGFLSGFWNNITGKGKEMFSQVGESASNWLSNSFSNAVPEDLSNMFGDLSYDDLITGSASDFGELLGWNTGAAFAQSLRDTAKKAMDNINNFFAENYSLPLRVSSYTSTARKRQKAMMYGVEKSTHYLAEQGDSFAKLADGIFNVKAAYDKTRESASNLGDTAINSSMLAEDSMAKLYDEIDKLFSEFDEAPITPIVDTSQWDSSMSKMQNDLSNLKASSIADTKLAQENTVNDWELSVEELVRKYSTISRSHDVKTGQDYVWWTYNGPMGGSIIENEVEWVYEGPTSGTYEPATDEYLVQIKDQVVHLSEWTDTLTNIYNGQAASQDRLDEINYNTTKLNAAIINQDEQQQKYYQDILDQLYDLNTNMSEIDSSISGYNNSLSNLGLYLDGDTLVGGITDKLEKNLNLNNQYRSMGVIG